MAKGKGKGKARVDAGSDEDTRLVILIERAERLKESMPDMLVPLARLRELVSVFLYVEVSVIRSLTGQDRTGRKSL